MASDFSGVVVFLTIPVTLIIWLVAMFVNVQQVVVCIWIGIGFNALFLWQSHTEIVLIQIGLMASFIVPFLRWSFKSDNQEKQ